MRNIKTELKGDNLLITINLKEKGQPSKSGKTNVIASTEGNVQVDGKAGLYIGVNVYTKPMA